MIDSIDDDRGAYGIEPICKVLPIAPSTYHIHVAKRVDPTKLSAQAKRDRALCPEFARVFAEKLQGLWCTQGLATVGTRKRAGRALHGGAHDGRSRAAGRDLRQAGSHDDLRQSGIVPARSYELPVPCPGTESVWLLDFPTSALGPGPFTWPS